MPWPAVTAWLILITYLVLFFWASREAMRASGQPVWLFRHARGRDRFAALGFRLAFVLAVLGPLAAIMLPGVVAWPVGVNVTGVALASIGMTLAFGAQMGMGASWRIGVQAGSEGPLVTTGLFRISRNPTFLGQGILLAGVLLASPSAFTLIGFGFFAAAASVQIHSEESLLRDRYCETYDQWARQVPRWIGLGGRKRG